MFGLTTNAFNIPLCLHDPQEVCKQTMKTAWAFAYLNKNSFMYGILCSLPCLGGGGVTEKKKQAQSEILL